jgi:DNA repair protein RadC
MRQAGLFDNSGFEFYKVLKVVQEVDAEYRSRTTFTSAEDVAEIIHQKIGDYANEVCGVLMLDTKHRLTGWGIVGQGSLDICAASPREVFLPALLSGAAAVIFFHNHPSGDTTPSRNDIILTEQLVKAGKILGVQVLDHVVVGGQADNFTSFLNKGLILAGGR